MFTKISRTRSLRTREFFGLNGKPGLADACFTENRFLDPMPYILRLVLHEVRYQINFVFLKGTES